MVASWPRTASAGDRFEGPVDGVSRGRIFRVARQRHLSKRHDTYTRFRRFLQVMDDFRRVFFNLKAVSCQCETPMAEKLVSSCLLLLFLKKK